MMKMLLYTENDDIISLVLHALKNFVPLMIDNYELEV